MEMEEKGAAGMEELCIEFLGRDNYVYFGHFQEEDDAAGVDPVSSLRFVPPEDSPFSMWTLVVLGINAKADAWRDRAPE